MKTTKILSLLFISMMFWSCSEDEAAATLTSPTFEITLATEGGDGIYTFTNTTPDKEQFFSFWQLSDNGVLGSKMADPKEGLKLDFGTLGSRTAILTMLSSSTNLSSSQNFNVEYLAEGTVVAFDSGLIANGDLEAGSGDTFEAWELADNGSGATFTAETTEFRSGARSLKITNPNDDPGNQWKTQLKSDAIATEVGSSYQISFWVKGDPVIVRASTNAGLGNESYMGDMTTGSDWTEYNMSFDALVGSTTIVLDVGASAGTFYIDDIRVIKN